MHIQTVITQSNGDYELLDAGEGMKLERYGNFVVSRPDPQALWKKSLPQSEWQKAQAQFVTGGAEKNKQGKESKEKDKKGSWKLDASVPKKWEVAFNDVKFWIKTSAFKHTGLFPEQAENWKWIGEKVKTSLVARKLASLPSKGDALRRDINKKSDEGNPPLREVPAEGVAVDVPIKVLNLFGYTGGASLAAAKAGAEVTHVDGSKVAVTWAKENAELSGLGEKPIRWILDDAAKFVEREIRRGATYDAIIMDPPNFGRGPDGEIWKIEESLIPFLDNCKKLLTPEPLFILVNGYASGYSAIAYHNALSDLMRDKTGSVSVGELALQTTSGKLLPAGIFVRWSRS
jgi:23S rRNA (cytosine1962-C5)-methyltransferase